MAGDPVPPPRPTRQLDVATVEGLTDCVAIGSPDVALLKSRDFPELQGLELAIGDIQTVLYDIHSLDSFAACFAARAALGAGARYVGVTRGTTIDDLEDVDVTSQVVAMVGVCWSVEYMIELARECDWLLILETHSSVAQELEQFNYPNAVRIFDMAMSAGTLAWNFFLPGAAVPPLLRALEDAELGRKALQNATDFARGFEAAFGFKTGRGEILYDDAAFQEFELLLDGGGRASIERAVEMGSKLESAVAEHCRSVAAGRVVRTMRAFPAWRCALLNVSSPFAGDVAEHLALQLASDCGEAAAHRCFGAVFEVRSGRVRVVLRSLPGGPDVSEIAARQDGSGRSTRAFFSIAAHEWEDLWVQPEPILWDVASSGEQCLGLKRGDLVTVAHRGERFRESPADEWSWGYKCDDVTVEGWIPTLAHTLFVATRSVPSAGPGVSPLDEGDLIVAQGQQGQYMWGSAVQKGQGWFPCAAGALMPVHASGAQALLASGGFVH